MVVRYEQQIGAGAGVGPQARASGYSGLGEGLQGLGQALQGLGATEMAAQAKLQNDENHLWVSKTASQFSMDQAKSYQDRINNLKPGAPNFTGETIAEFDKAKDSILLKAPNEKAKRQLELQLIGLKESLYGDSLKTEGVERLRYSRQVGLDAIGEGEKAVDAVPNLYEAQLAQKNQVIDGLPISGPEKEKLKQIAKERLSWVRAYRDMKTNPENYVRQRGDAQKSGPAFEGGKVSDSYKRRLAQVESGGNPNARNPSGATGLYQIMPRTAKQYGVTNRLDVGQQEAFIEKFTADNAAYLKKQLGREPTQGELYLAHQQGPGGAARLLANPNELAVNVVGYQAVIQNGGAPGMTAGQFAAKWISKFEGSKLAFIPKAAQTGDPAFDSLSYDQRIQLFNQADTAARQQQAAFRGEFENNLENAVASYKTIGTYAGPDIGRDQFVAAYGEAEADERYNSFLAVKEAGQDVVRYKTMPADAILADIEASKPVLGQENFAQAQSLYAARSEAAQKLITDRNNDPVGYVSSVYPEIGKAMQSATDDVSRDKARRQLYAAQEQLGIPEQSRAVLTSQEAININKTFANDAIADEGIKAAPLMTTLMSISDPKMQKVAFDQLVKAGIPYEARRAVEAFARKDYGAARRITSVLTKPPNDIPNADLSDADLKAAWNAYAFGEQGIGFAMYSPETGKAENRSIMQSDEKLGIMLMKQWLVQNRKTDANEVPEEAITAALADLNGDKQHVVGDNFNAFIDASSDPGTFEAGVTQVLDFARSAVSLQLRDVTPDLKDGSPQAEINFKIAQKWLSDSANDGTVQLRPYQGNYAFLDTTTGLFISNLKTGQVMTWTAQQINNAGAASLNARPEPITDPGQAVP